MALEAVPNYNDFFNFMVYDTLNTPHYGCNSGFMEDFCLLETNQNLSGEPSLNPVGQGSGQGTINRSMKLGVQGRNKRRRRGKVGKNKEEAETQRLTHITVERNRRKQMNEHLAVLRSLMPESYAQRGDQASIVGGAIQFVKELEHLVQSLEVQKLIFLQTAGNGTIKSEPSETPITTDSSQILASSFSGLISDSEQTFSQVGNKYTLKSKAPAADIEVTLIETHANLRILLKKNPRQISKLVSGFQALCLSVLHLNVSTMDPLVMYSINVKVEEGCQLTSVDSIAEAVLHMLRIIEQENDVPILLTY